jgi:hypothetical protein
MWQRHLQRSSAAAIPRSGRACTAAASRDASGHSEVCRRCKSISTGPDDCHAACCRESAHSSLPCLSLQSAPLPAQLSGPAIRQRRRAASKQPASFGKDEAAATDVPTADGLSAQTSKAKLQALRKGELATALRTRMLDDQGLKPELVDRLYTALQQGRDEHAASAERPPVQQAPAAADSAAALQPSTATGNSAVIGRQPASTASAAGPPGVAAAAAPPVVPVSQPITAPAQAAEPTALSAELPHSMPAAEPAKADLDVHSATSSAAAPAAVSTADAARPQLLQGQQVPAECHVPTGLAVQWLGTSSGAPTAQRNVSSILLLQQHRVLMVDCGEGTVNQLATAGIDPILVQG